jgi:anti-sigma-K factor RskA
MIFSAPQTTAPADVRSAVLSHIQTIPQPRIAMPNHAATATTKLRSFGLIGWAAAAALAIIGAYGWNTANRTNEALAAAQAKVQELEVAAGAARAMELSLKQELARLTQTHEVAKMQIATLQSTVSEYQQGVAVVVWNSEKQEGILKLEKMPPVALDKDYQLWVVDPSKKTPVNAGVVKVDAKGFAKVEFKPTVDVQQADKFALSVEKKGGVAENEGPIILLSE